MRSQHNQIRPKPLRSAGDFLKRFAEADFRCDRKTRRLLEPFGKFFQSDIPLFDQRRDDTVHRIGTDNIIDRELFDDIQQCQFGVKSRCNRCGPGQGAFRSRREVDGDKNFLSSIVRAFPVRRSDLPVGTVRTEHGAWRTTRSVVLPNKTRLAPV